MRKLSFALILIVPVAHAAAPSAPAPPSPEPQANPQLEQVRKAIRVFRQVTAEDGLRPGQGEAKKRTRATSGRTSSWHGRVFNYVRNNSFDAVPHEVVQRGGDRNILRRNQFGFSVNGPVVLPKLYDGRGKSFFTFSYEGTRERVGRSYLLTTPTTQQRQGDFSDLVNRAGDPLTVYDPASTRLNPLHDPSQDVSRTNLEYDRDPFPDNRIPASRLDRVSQAINEHYPQPNDNVGPFLRNNYWSNPSERNTPDGFIARLDHSIGAKQKVTLEIRSSDGFQDTPDIYGTAGDISRPDRTFTNRDLELADTVNLTPNLTYRGSIDASLQTVDTLSALGDRSLPQELGLGGVNGAVFPNVRFRGYVGLGPSQNSFLRNAQKQYEIENELIWRRGKHTWTYSNRAYILNWNTHELDAPSGSFQFDDRITGLPGITNTGDSYATFLLGQAPRAEVTDQLQPSYLQRRSFSNTIADQWQIVDTLTLTMRVRIEGMSPRTEKFDRQSTFDPEAINPANGAPGALVFAARDGEGRAFQPYRLRAEPRLGISWSPTSDRNTVVRGSFGRFYSPIPLRSGPFGTQGFSGRRSPISPNRQLTPAVTLQDGFPELGAELPDLRGDFANNTDVDLIPKTDAQPTYNHAELELERRLPRGVVFRASGRSTRGRDLLFGGSILGLNRAPVTALAFRDRLNDEAFRRSLRPFPHVQEVRTSYLYPGGRYRYDSGEVNVQKQTGDGLSLDLEYAYRRRFDDYSGPGIQDPSDRSTAWARSRGLRPQRLSLSYTYELPFGPGKSVFNRAGVMAKVMSDWSVSGFTSWYSGDPISIEPSFNNTGGIVPYLRASSVPGVDPHVEDPGPGQWFNPLAFVDPADFTLGDVSRSHPTLRNPSYRNHDLALTKRLALSREQSIEVLVQGFNFLNQGNWNDPDTEIGPAHARNKNAGKIIGSRGGRVLQLGLRYNF